VEPKGAPLGLDDLASSLGSNWAISVRLTAARQSKDPENEANSLLSFPRRAPTKHSSRALPSIRYSNYMAIEQPAPPPAHGAGRTVAWLAKQVERALTEVELSLAQYRVLGFLSEGSAVSSAVAERLAVRPPSVTAVIDGLVARGLVARHAIEGDRRSVSLVVTDEGARVLALAEVAVDSRLSGIAVFLDDDDGGKRALADLGRWNAALRHYHRACQMGER
jgi:DNA-binding MarR family transcriptional regulator